MKRFFKKLLLIALCCYALLFVLELAVDAGVRESSDNYRDMNPIFAGAIKDRMVVFGNSRAQTHFDPVLIEKQTGISVYNLGTSGINLDFERIRWNSFMTHNHPEIVLQNIDLMALSDENLADKRLYLPYYGQPEMFDLLCEIDASARLERWIPMSKYRGFEPLVMKGVKALFKDAKSHKKSKGYRKQTQTWNGAFARFKASLNGKPVDFSKTDFTTGFERLQQKITDCKKRNIRLILVWSPQYRELSELQEPTFSRMKAKVAAMAQENRIAFWDFSQGSINNDTRYFHNSFHMNATGVEVFNRQLSDSLKTLK
jgi:hypothetical protein